MKRFGVDKFLGLAAMLAAFAGAAGCADETASTETEESEGVAQAPLEQEPPRAEGAEEGDRRVERLERRGDGERGDRGPRGEHGPMGKMGKKGHGPEKLLFVALKELELTDAQRTALEGAAESLREARPEPKRDGASPMKAVADQVRAGKVDAAALEKEMAAHKPDFAAHRAATTEALATLHATLTPEQRKQLVALVTERMDERAEKMDDERAERAQRKGDHGKGEHAGKGGPLMHLVDDLELRDDQRSKVEAILEGLKPSEADRAAFEAKHAEREKELRARLAAFAADRFDAAAAVPEPKEGFKADHHAKMAQALAAIVPILDAEQRAVLADRIEEGPRHHGRGMKGPRGKRGR